MQGAGKYAAAADAPRIPHPHPSLLVCYWLAVLGSLALTIFAMCGCESADAAREQGTIDADLAVALCALPEAVPEVEPDPVAPESGEPPRGYPAESGSTTPKPEQLEPTPAQIYWCSSIEEAREKSEADGRPVWIHWHFVGCGPCKQLEHDLFGDEEFLKAAGEVHAVKIDTLERPDLKAKWNVRGLPSDYIVRGDTWQSYRRRAYYGRDEWLTWWRGAVAKARVQDAGVRGQGKKTAGAAVRPSPPYPHSSLLARRASRRRRG